MAIGRTFLESLQKAIRSLETGRLGLNGDPGGARFDDLDADELVRQAASPTPDRLFQLEAALRQGRAGRAAAEVTGIDPWFLDQLAQRGADPRHPHRPKRRVAVPRATGSISRRSGSATRSSPTAVAEDPEPVRQRRLAAGRAGHVQDRRHLRGRVRRRHPLPLRHLRGRGRADPPHPPAVVILGSGPNRIGQGVEFDYCCVHAAFALSDAGYETVMVNCNPETVSTDYDTSDRLFFEPLAARRRPQRLRRGCTAGPASLRRRRRRARRPDPPEAGAGPRNGRHPRPRDQPGVDRPGRGPRAVQRALRTARHPPTAGRHRRSTPTRPAPSRRQIGYPVLVRPSYVLGGRAMRIVYTDAELDDAMARGRAGPGSLGREGGLSAERPALIDRFLEDAVEVDVDALRDHTGEVLVGRHHGAHRAGRRALRRLGVRDPARHAARPGARRHRGPHPGPRRRARRPRPPQRPVRGQGRRGLRPGGEPDERAARCRSSARRPGVPLAKVAARLDGRRDPRRAARRGAPHRAAGVGHVAVKEAVLPFDRFPDVDTVLGPEMRSTGEVMGIDRSFGLAFAKSQAGGRQPAPRRRHRVPLPRRPRQAGRPRRGPPLRRARLRARRHRAAPPPSIEADGPPRRHRRLEGGGGDRRRRGRADLVRGRSTWWSNTPRGRGPRADGDHIRRAATRHRVACITTVAAAVAAAAGIAERAAHDPQVRSLQDYHRDGAAAPGRLR